MMSSSAASPFRELLIIRHAKSDWSDPDLPDHERPLAEKGRRQACRMGHWLRDHDLMPQLILTSPARRARQTLTRLTRHWPDTPEIHTLTTLYHGDTDAFLTQLDQLLAETDARRIALIGHNPLLEQLIEQLTGESVALPTCAIAHLLLPERLTQPVEGCARLLTVLRPADAAARTTLAAVA